MRKEKIIDGFLLIIIIACVFGFIIQLRERQAIRPWSLTKAEGHYIMQELDSRGVGDCVVEPVILGWKCTDKAGEIYLIARR